MSPSMLTVGCDTRRSFACCHARSSIQCCTPNYFLAVASLVLATASAIIPLSCSLSGGPLGSPPLVTVLPSSDTRVSSALTWLHPGAPPSAVRAAWTSLHGPH